MTEWAVVCRSNHALAQVTLEREPNLDSNLFGFFFNYLNELEAQASFTTQLCSVKSKAKTF